MPCEHYKDALSEAAATGGEPRGELRAHLDDCLSCRATFAEEEQLFAAVDAGLHTVANADPSPSFLLRLRARLDEVEATQDRRISLLILAASSVALMAAVFLATRSHQARPREQAKRILATSPRETQGANGFVASARKSPAQTGRKSVLVRLVVSNEPEVIVPPDEREAFARFVKTLRERDDVAVALVTPSTDEKGEPASPEQLQIKRLELKPLEDMGSETSEGVENIR